MVPLFELKARARVAKVEEAVNGVLRTAGEPLSSSALVKAIAPFLDVPRERWQELARMVTDLARTHPQARQTGETFRKYGREMRRWEWLPAHKKPGLSRAELERRRAKIAAEEADEWTVPPREILLEDEPDVG